MLHILTSIPHNTHYINRYYKFIQSCIKLNSTNITSEKHHICPKSLFPELTSFHLNPNNLANLTPRQHFIAHWMLWKAYGGKMAYAFHLMLSTKNDAKINSKSYSKCKYDLSSLLSLNMINSNPMSNPESRSKVSLSKLGNKNPNFGKSGTMLGKTHSKDTITKLKYIASTRDRVICEYCNKSIDSSNYSQFHGELCSLNPNINSDIILNRKLKAKIASDKAKQHITCEYCNKSFSSGMYTRWHGVNCKLAKLI